MTTVLLDRGRHFRLSNKGLL